jgi:hypothetical protein
MARIFTTSDAEQKAKAWLNIVTVSAGLRNDPNVTISDIQFKQASDEVCTEIVNRDFKNVDSSIQWLSRFTLRTPTGKRINFNKAQVAKCLVYMADLVGLYWDDTVRTPYEIDEFKKSLLGEAVYKYGRYISAIQPPKATRSTTKSTASGGGGGTKSAPQNGYKSSGPQSGNVRDLQGNPNEKVIADTNFIYKIIADKIGKNTPNVFIKPLSASGVTGSTNKIFISSGNGYTDCTCYFDDPNDAQAFLDKIIAANRVPANINNIRVVKMKADPNGYFLVGTEFGTVAVSAKTLNEAFEVNEDLSGGWKKATEKYSKEELDELHTWMRKD